MSEQVRVRLLLCKHEGDTEPTIVGAMDETVWELIDERAEEAWLKWQKQWWGSDPADYEWREVWATFAPGDLVAAFETPAVAGRVELEDE